jgi:hypothetical protein
MIEYYPNPVQSTATFKFALALDGIARLEVVDMRGNSVGVVYSGVVHAKEEITVDFDASKLTSGLYFYRLSTGTEVLSGKFILVKE